jgi:hypothetical protein
MSSFSDSCTAGLALLRRAARAVARRRGLLETPEALRARMKADPTLVFRKARMTPDPWQAEALASDAPRALWVCSRRIGKSETAAALALKTAVVDAPALVLIVSPALRQSAELFRKVSRLYGCLVRGDAGRLAWRPQRLRDLYAAEEAAGEELVQESKLSLEMANGSRVVALPGKEGSIRSFSAVKLLLLDEAARIPDELYNSVRPMLAVSRGRLVALSSTWAKRGWFYEAYVGRGEWARVRKTCWDCPRLGRDFLESERQDIGPRWFRMEYEAEFSDPVEALFTEAEVRRAVRPSGGEVWFT